MSQYIPELFKFDANDPSDMQRAMSIVFDQEGPLAVQSDGDQEYLRLLQVYAISEIMSGSDRENPDKARKMNVAFNLLTAYEGRIFGPKP